MLPHLATASGLPEATNVSEAHSNAQIPYSSLPDPYAGLRVNKLDASILDTEILSLLQEPAKSMFSMFPPGTADRVQPELQAALSALFFYFTTGRRKPTPGMRLENIQYVSTSLTKEKLTSLFLLSIALPYVWKRTMRYLSTTYQTAESSTSSRWEVIRPTLLKSMNRLETFTTACRLLNLLLFLKNGGFRSLSERLLNIPMTNLSVSTKPRAINFEYMTRHLLWAGLLELGNCVVPLLAWGGSRVQKTFAIGSEQAPNVGQCALCGLSPPNTPYITSCKHVYCYYCLQTAVATDDSFKCVVCNVQFDTSHPLRT